MMRKISNTSLSFWKKKKPQKRGIDGAHNEPWYAEQNSSSQKRWQKIDPKELCKGTVN